MPQEDPGWMPGKSPTLGDSADHSGNLELEQMLPGPFSVALVTPAHPPSVWEASITAWSAERPFPLTRHMWDAWASIQDPRVPDKIRGWRRPLFSTPCPQGLSAVTTDALTPGVRDNGKSVEVRLKQSFERRETEMPGAIRKTEKHKAQGELEPGTTG